MQSEHKQTPILSPQKVIKVNNSFAERAL